MPLRIFVFPSGSCRPVAVDVPPLGTAWYSTFGFMRGSFKIPKSSAKRSRTSSRCSVPRQNNCRSPVSALETSWSPSSSSKSTSNAPSSLSDSRRSIPERSKANMQCSHLELDLPGGASTPTSSRGRFKSESTSPQRSSLPRLGGAGTRTRSPGPASWQGTSLPRMPCANICPGVNASTWCVRDTAFRLCSAFNVPSRMRTSSRFRLSSFLCAKA
mmetsp:Transcript_108979/g.216440  ORF Transcript_108979/g.216440 Transcript_108979/m.216440 type:complete len:215 (+) Transcript_108979:878-1522(+)